MTSDLLPLHSCIAHIHAMRNDCVAHLFHRKRNVMYTNERVTKAHGRRQRQPQRAHCIQVLKNAALSANHTHSTKQILTRLLAFISVRNINV